MHQLVQLICVNSSRKMQLDSVWILDAESMINSRILVYIHFKELPTDRMLVPLMEIFTLLLSELKQPIRKSG